MKKCIYITFYITIIYFISNFCIGTRLFANDTYIKSIQKLINNTDYKKARNLIYEANKNKNIDDTDLIIIEYFLAVTYEMEGDTVTAISILNKIIKKYHGTKGALLAKKEINFINEFITKPEFINYFKKYKKYRDMGLKDNQILEIEYKKYQTIELIKKVGPKNFIGIIITLLTIELLLSIIIIKKINKKLKIKYNFVINAVMGCFLFLLGIIIQLWLFYEYLLGALDKKMFSYTILIITIIVYIPLILVYVGCWLSDLLIDFCIVKCLDKSK